MGSNGLPAPPIDRLRATLYRIAATLFDRPQAEHLHRLRALIASLLYRAPANAVWLEPLAAIAEQLSHEQRLIAEHTRLFVLTSALRGIAAQPYESHWAAERPSLMEAEGARIRGLRRCCGRCVLVPDHIVSELQLMACLIEQESTSAVPESTLFRRLRCWVPRFLTAVRAADPPPAPFYCRAADFLEQLLRWDTQHLAHSVHITLPSAADRHDKVF